MFLFQYKILTTLRKLDDKLSGCGGYKPISFKIQQFKILHGATVPDQIGPQLIY